jgi:hypothetical protein
MDGPSVSIHKLLFSAANLCLLIHQLQSGSLEDQFKCDCADCNDEYRFNTGVDTQFSDFPVVPSMQAA